MARDFKLTWQAGSDKRSGRWRKKFRGKAYYFDGGRGKSDRNAYEKALKDWELIKLRLIATEPRKHQTDYESVIDEWDQVLAWSNRHNETEMAQIAFDKLKKLKEHLESPTLTPISPTDRFESLFKLPTIDLPSDFFDKAKKALFSAEDLSFKWTPPSQEKREQLSAELDGSPLRIAREIWKDRLDSQQRRSVIQKQSLEDHIDEFLIDKEKASQTKNLTLGRLYAIRLHLSQFQSWAGKDTPVIDVDSTMLKNYHSMLVDSINSGKWSTTTARHYMVSVKAFVRWLWQVESIPALPRVLDGKSKVLNIGTSVPEAIEFSQDEIQIILEQAQGRTKLYILLMLNCGMTQKDISDLKKSEVDLITGRITRKRSKTSGFGSVPTVEYLLWSETLQMLQQFADKSDSEHLLLNKNGSPLWTESYTADGKYKKNDNIKNAFERLKKKLGIEKPLKSLKKSSASRLRNDSRYHGLEDLFLGHAPQKMSDKHYTTTPQELFDTAIMWLAETYGLKSALSVENVEKP